MPGHDESAARAVKVVVWDLDNTLWEGILAEGDDVRLREGAADVLATLDGRGILHSIASKNDPGEATARLEELGVADYFLHPQINWSSKAANVEKIARALNLGLDALCFIDDQPFEREEVAHSLPQVLTLDAAEMRSLPDRPELMPRFITGESKLRRRMYQSEAARQRAEGEYVGPAEEFLATLGMRFAISLAEEEDLQRAEELTVRTHQLNTTGYTYSYDELNDFRRSADHLLLVASLEDKYGPYGKIGLALVEKRPATWTLKLLLMSCRVMSRGVGTILLNYIMGLAEEAGVGLLAEFRSSDRNRMMLVTYKFAGFKEVEQRGELVVFEADLSRIQPPPDYVDVHLPQDVPT